MSAGQGSGLSRSTLVALTAGMSVGYLFGGILPEVVATLQGDLGLTTTLSGAVATATLLAIAVAALLSSGRASRAGRWKLAVAGAGTGAFGYLLSALAEDNVALLMVCGAVAGAGAGATLAAATAALATTADPDRASGTAVLSLTLLGAILLAVLPIVSGGQHWIVMVTLAGVCLVALPFLRRLPDAVVVRTAQESGRNGMGAVLLVGALLFKVAETGLWAFTDDLGVTVVGMSQGAVGLTLAAAALAGLFGAGVQLFLGDRFGRFLPIMVLLLLDIVSRALLLTTTSPAVFVVTNLIWMAAFVALIAYVLALGAAMDPSGRWAALAASAMALGDATGPFLSGLVLDLGGYGHLMLMSLILGTGTIAALTTVARHIDRTSRQAFEEPAVI